MSIGVGILTGSFAGCGVVPVRNEKSAPVPVRLSLCLSVSLSFPLPLSLFFFSPRFLFSSSSLQNM